MGKWLHYTDIQQHFTNDTSWESVILSANNIATELRKLPEDLFSDLSFADDVEYLESVSMEDSDYYSSVDELLDEINGRLSMIYNFADEERIWLGGK